MALAPDATYNPTRIVLETNLGGLPMILCGCGVLLFETMQNGHLDQCETYQQHLADEAADA